MLVKELRQAARLLVERAGGDREDHDRPDGLGEDFLGRKTWGILLLLAGLLGSERPPLHLPDPCGSTGPQVHQIPIGLRSVGAIGSRNFPGVLVQPDERADRQPSHRIRGFNRDHHRCFGRMQRRGTRLSDPIRPWPVRIRDPEGQILRYRSPGATNP